MKINLITAKFINRGQASKEECALALLQGLVSSPIKGVQFQFAYEDDVFEKALLAL